MGARGTRADRLTRSRPLGWALIVAAAWTAFVWISRLSIMARDGEDRTTGFLLVHTGLAVVSLALAVPVAIAGWRMRARPERRA